jgi:hypothetical protein
MSEPIVRKVALMASQDWTLRAAMAEFHNFLQPVLKWRGKRYRLELTRVLARPVVAGTDQSADADLIVDRTTHWNSYYRSWAHQAANSLGRFVNHPYTFFVYDKHATYDLMARAMHPADRFPKTVLLPLFNPWTPDQVANEWWQYEQKLVLENTELGFDPRRRKTDWAEVKRSLEHARRREERTKKMRDHFSIGGNWLKETVENVFGNRFPLYLKKAYGGGGARVWKVNDLKELYARFDRTGTEEAFHLQEAIDPYDKFYRCMGIGPIVFPMIFQPEQPLHSRYGTEKPVMDKEVYRRLQSYVMFINSYHRWTYNSFECLMRGGQLHPIDFANACPDSHFTSLHVHFPLTVVSLLKWLAFCAVTEKDLRIDMEMTHYLKVLNDPQIGAEEKFEFCRTVSDEYFEVDRFDEFCAESFPDVEERMIDFYDQKWDEILRYAIDHSDFPDHEHERFYQHYHEMMDKQWRPNAKRYLSPVVFE